jgi:flagellar hook-length control protein FliK
LGKIDVQLRVVGDQMNARLEVSSHLARHMVESNLPQLRETLATQGIKVDSFSVDVSGGNQGQDNSGQAANQNGGRSGFANRGNFAHSPESMPENQNRTMGAQNLRGRINLFA